MNQQPVRPVRQAGWQCAQAAAGYALRHLGALPKSGQFTCCKTGQFYLLPTPLFFNLPGFGAEQAAPTPIQMNKAAIPTHWRTLV